MIPRLPLLPEWGTFQFGAFIESEFVFVFTIRAKSPGGSDATRSTQPPRGAKDSSSSTCLSCLSFPLPSWLVSFASLKWLFRLSGDSKQRDHAHFAGLPEQGLHHQKPGEIPATLSATIKGLVCKTCPTINDKGARSNGDCTIHPKYSGGESRGKMKNHEHLINLILDQKIHDKIHRSWGLHIFDQVALYIFSRNQSNSESAIEQTDKNRQII